MIGPVIPEAYDFEGTKTLIPVRTSSPIFRPTFPMGRFIACPLTVECESVEDIRAFLSSCRYVTDLEQFGKKDYWLPPDKFEETRRGDCEDFSLWTWRQLIALGYPSRLVVGYSGRYGAGHAWLQAVIDGDHCLVEPLGHWIKRLPRLSTVRYKPEVSVDWDGKKFRYFKHESHSYNPQASAVVPLLWEWLTIWFPLWPRIARGLLQRLFRLAVGRRRSDAKRITS